MSLQVECPGCGACSKDNQSDDARWATLLDDHATDVAMSRPGGMQWPDGPRVFVCRCRAWVWIDVVAFVPELEPVTSGGVWFQATLAGLAFTGAVDTSGATWSGDEAAAAFEKLGGGT